MKQIIRNRKLTTEEASKYNKIREQIEKDLPDLIAQHNEKNEKDRKTKETQTGTVEEG